MSSDSNPAQPVNLRAIADIVMTVKRCQQKNHASINLSVSNKIIPSLSAALDFAMTCLHFMI